MWPHPLLEEVWFAHVFCSRQSNNRGIYLYAMLNLYIPILCIVIVMILRVTKRRLVYLGTGVFAGLLIVNRMILPSTSSCISATCHTGPAYQLLRRNEMRIEVNHPLISSVHINYLPSNHPNEDRFSIGTIKEHCTSLFAVIDGHKTDDCSDHLKDTLLPYVVHSLKEGGVVKSDIEMVDVHRHADTIIASTDTCDTTSLDNVKVVDNLLHQGFMSLDKNISEEALKCFRLVNKGHSIKENNRLKITMRAIAGACALVAMVTDKMVYIANTGDCRVILGVKEKGVWSATPLSQDQNAHNKDEVVRIISAHPGEEKTVISMGRILGSLMPFRSFGDVELKWPQEQLDLFGSYLANYLTPPYLTADPVVTNKIVTSSDKFMVLATDGLWEKLSNEKVVETVSNIGVSSRKTGLMGFFSRQQQEECCSYENSATTLLWEALGGTEDSVDNMLRIPPRFSRLHRDDITVLVVHFKDKDT